MEITDEMLHGATIEAEIADELLFACEASILARGEPEGVTEENCLVVALWRYQQEKYPADAHAKLAATLRRMADSVDRAVRPH